MIGTGCCVLVDFLQLFRAYGDRSLNVLGIATDLCAPLIENVVLLLEVVGRTECIELVGVLCDKSQGDFLATATDHERNLAVHRTGIEFGHAFLDDGKSGLENLQAPWSGSEFVAVLGVVALEPPGTNPEDEPAIADVVDGACHVGEQLGVAVRVARHECTDGCMLGVGCHRGKQRVALEVFSIGVAEQRIEVVPCPQTVDTEVVGALPCVAHGLNGGRLGLDLYADLHALNLA